MYMCLCPIHSCMSDLLVRPSLPYKNYGCCMSVNLDAVVTLVEVVHCMINLRVKVFRLAVVDSAYKGFSISPVSPLFGLQLCVHVL